MNTTRTARVSRTKVAATAAALVCAALALTACSGPSTATEEPASSSSIEQYQLSNEIWRQLVVDGETIYYIQPLSQSLADDLTALEAGEIDPDAEYVTETGRLNDARNMVVWEDGDFDNIAIATDTVMFRNDIYYPFDSEQAVKVREAKWAEIEDGKFG